MVLYGGEHVASVRCPEYEFGLPEAILVDSGPILESFVC